MNFTIILLIVLFVIIIFMEYEQSKEIENYTIKEINRNHLYSFKKIDNGYTFSIRGRYCCMNVVFHLVNRVFIFI